MRVQFHLLSLPLFLVGLAFFGFGLFDVRFVLDGLDTFQRFLCGIGFLFLAGLAELIRIGARALEILDAEWIVRDPPKEVEEIKQIRRRNRKRRED
jgi:hypothetical protein